MQAYYVEKCILNKFWIFQELMTSIQHFRNIFYKSIILIVVGNTRCNKGVLKNVISHLVGYKCRPRGLTKWHVYRYCPSGFYVPRSGAVPKRRSMPRPFLYLRELAINWGKSAVKARVAAYTLIHMWRNWTVCRKKTATTLIEGFA